jgi:hypothetical protein
MRRILASIVLTSTAFVIAELPPGRHRSRSLSCGRFCL